MHNFTLDQTFAQHTQAKVEHASTQILQLGANEILVGFIHSFRRRATDSEICQSLSRFVKESINLGKSASQVSIHLLSQAQESLQII